MLINDNDSMDFYIEYIIPKSQNYKLFRFKDGSLKATIAIIYSMSCGFFSLIIPYTFCKLGFMSSIIIAIFTCLSNYRMNLIQLDKIDQNKQLNYSNLIEELIGKNFCNIVNFVNVIYFIILLWCVQIIIFNFSYLLIENYFSIELQETSSFSLFNKRIIYLIIVLFIQIPIGLYFKNISNLFIACLYCIIVQFVTITIVFFNCNKIIVIADAYKMYISLSNEHDKNTQTIQQIIGEGLDFLSIINLVFFLQNTIPSIINEMHNPTYIRTKKVIKFIYISYLFSFIIYGYLGIYYSKNITSQLFLDINYDYYINTINNYNIETTKNNLTITGFKNYSLINIDNLLKEDFYFRFIAMFMCLIMSLFQLILFSFNLLDYFKNMLPNNINTTYAFELNYIVIINIISSLLAYNINNVKQVIGLISGVISAFLGFIVPVTIKIASKYNRNKVISNNNQNILVFKNEEKLNLSSVIKNLTKSDLFDITISIINFLIGIIITFKSLFNIIKKY